MSTPRHARRPFAPDVAALVALILVAGCGSATTSPSTTTSTSPTPAATSTLAPDTTASPASSLTADAIYDAVEQQVVAIRGLKPTKPVARHFIAGTELRRLPPQQ